MLYYSLDEGAAHPRQAYKHDAGIDLALKHPAIIPAGQHRLCHTGVHIAIPRGEVGMLFVRSSTGIKKHLVLSNGTGIIDAGYIGEIMLSLHNTGHRSQHIPAGHYIAQLVVVPIAPNDICEVPHLDPTQRGDKGIGSTDASTA